MMPMLAQFLRINAVHVEFAVDTTVERTMDQLNENSVPIIQGWMLEQEDTSNRCRVCRC